MNFKPFINKYKSLYPAIYLYILLVLIFLIPLHLHLTADVIGLLVLVWIGEGNFKHRMKNIIRSNYTILFASYYLIYVIGLTYSGNLDFGLKDLGRKLSFLIFPLFFSSMESSFMEKLDLRKYFKVYIMGCTVGSMICLINSTYKYIKDGNYILNFYYDNLSILFHQTYFAMFLDFGIAVIIYYLIEDEGRNLLYRKLISYFLLLFFSLMVVLLSSKAGIISLCIVFFFSLVYLIFIKKRYVVSILFFFIMCTVLITLIKVFPFSIKRASEVKEAFYKKWYLDKETKEGTASRLLVWETCIKMIKRHALFGVGTGDVKEELIRSYKEEHILNAYNLKLNAHNEFLQVFVGTGIVGFLILVLCLMLPLIISIKELNGIYFIFLILILLNIFVESMFERQAGIVFYAFFNSLLFYNRIKS